jgi:hypothetical protein
MGNKTDLKRSMAVKRGLDSSGSRQGQVASCYGHVNEPPVFHNMNGTYLAEETFAPHKGLKFHGVNSP